MGSRIAVIRIPLTPEQQARVRAAAGGAVVAEALVAGPVEQEEPLENEVFGAEAERLAEEIWHANEVFVDKLNGLPRVKADFEVHTGHEVFPDVPNIAILR
ncbi:hypothetical protein ACWGHM_37400 [Streptomyces sp. NPDC054904]|uniref:hypothetical protein n=1 Tax=unclassified Streptomyces TaxID=2593676 RepID=UPI002481C4A7|nr:MULTISPECIES: hypothetical protein [unclassified Streptomyces]MDA5279824.1 hypothetical protein [Streptomyces sp. Isolate_45]MDX2391403.1 hypothetical protein [Streptomyces sp. DK15]